MSRRGAPDRFNEGKSGPETVLGAREFDREYTIVAVLVLLLACVGPVLYVAVAVFEVAGGKWLIDSCLLLALAWVISVTWSIFRFRRRALWLLLSAPLAGAIPGCLLWFLLTFPVPH